MLRQCLKNLKRFKREAELFLGNAKELPFGNESFDAVFHAGGINFFSEKEKAVEEMIRIARPSLYIKFEQILKGNGYLLEFRN